MTRREPPKLNEAYQKYKDNPTSENYEEFGSDLMSYVEAVIIRTCGSRFSNLEDIVSEACLEVLKDLPTFDPQKSSFKTWAYGVVYTTCQDHFKKVRREVEEELPLDTAKDQSYDFYRSIDAKLDLEKRVNKLSKQDQELIEMKKFGLSNGDIAQELGIEVRTIEKRWERVKERLRTLGVDNEVI